MTVPGPKPASIELGPYRLLERIGEGGSGQVFRARGPDGTVAIKVLGPAADLDDAARARLGREVAALQQIRHPHLVALLDHGIDAELGPYLVLPLLPGRSLRALCAGRALCPEAALLLLLPVIEAIAALHAAGYVHRDVKPENVIAGPDGAITVIDLGLAWREGMTRHTDTGVAVGSIGYMSPEQVEGRPVDDRADVWALGVMLYEAIAGARPFARPRPAEEAAAVLLGTCARLSSADRRAGEELAAIVADCLALDPARRPRAADLATALRELVDWTDDLPGERAAAVADPAGYQARVAAFRVRRIERLAREAIAAGKPFVALAQCDRGLAYAPDHAELLALVAAAEGATARPAPPSPEPTALSSRGSSWPWIAAAAGLFVGTTIVVLRWPSRSSGSDDEVVVSQSLSGNADLATIQSFFSTMTTLANRATSRPAPTDKTPETASGWLARAKQQPPAEAIPSIRHALAMQPGWPEAEAALCIALVATHDIGAFSPCERAIASRPTDAALLGARAELEMRTGRNREAVGDLDRAIRADPDPKWFRMRGEAKRVLDDTDGAKRDLANACQLGDAAACGE